VRIVLQRVRRASVTVDGEVVGAIGHGVLLLVGVGEGDDAAVAGRMASKVVRLRIFPGVDRGFEKSVVDVGGEALVVSQFTLMGDVRRGNRPSWAAAARPEDAELVVRAVAEALEAAGVPVATGRFGAMMDVDLLNDGPVTLVLDSDDMAAPRG
jgi:D-tyrosyl-tRNA(Tyr) deacylase